MTNGSVALDKLIAVLNLEQLADDVFLGRTPAGGTLRVFGGQVAGQALVAAVRTAPRDRAVHSLHGYFVRGGVSEIPITYEVDRVRDGGSFTTRRVLALQEGQVIFGMSASFQVLEEGFEHQASMPDVPRPDDLLPVQELHRNFGLDGPPSAWGEEPWPLELKYVGLPPTLAVATGALFPAMSQVWFRANGQLPDDPALHSCVLAYASDLALLESSLTRHAVALDGKSAVGASLDHALWFHRPFRADEWLLYDMTSPNASGGRALSMGRIYDQAGRLVASVVQEGLVRRPRPGAQTGYGMGLPKDGH